MSILQNGPDVHFRERTGEQLPFSYGFWLCRKGITEYPLGAPESYARLKAEEFPEQGGPVILEIDVPDEIVSLSDHEWYGDGTYQFTNGKGIEELLNIWQSLTKVIRDV